MLARHSDNQMAITKKTRDMLLPRLWERTRGSELSLATFQLRLNDVAE
jgi:hypothetical protein